MLDVFPIPFHVLLNYNFVESSLSSTGSGLQEAYPKPYSSFVSLFEFMALDISFLPLSCVASQRFGHVEALLASTLAPIGLVLAGMGVIAVRSRTLQGEGKGMVGDWNRIGP